MSKQTALDRIKKPLELWHLAVTVGAGLLAVGVAGGGYVATQTALNQAQDSTIAAHALRLTSLETSRESDRDLAAQNAADLAALRESVAGIRSDMDLVKRLLMEGR